LFLYQRLKTNRFDHIILGVILLVVWGISPILTAKAAIRINSISKDHGLRGDNTPVTITGEGFSPDTQVTIWGGGVYIKNSHPTKGDANALYCSGSYAYLACGREEDPNGMGVQIFNIQDPNTSPLPVSFFSLPEKVNDIFVFGDYAYVAVAGAGLQILDVQTPDTPLLVSSLELNEQEEAEKLSVYGNHIYLAIKGTRDRGLQIIDISDPNQPALAGSCAFDPNGSVQDVVVEQNYAYLADGKGGLKIINIQDSQHPNIVKTFPTPGRFVKGVYKYDNYLYLSEKVNGVEIVDVSNPEDPVRISKFTTWGEAYHVCIKENYLYVAAGQGIEIFHLNAQSPQNCTMVGFQETPGKAVHLQVFDNYVFVADSGGGLRILDAKNPRNPSIASMVNLTGNSKVFVKGLYLYIGDDTSNAYVFSEGSSNALNWVKVLDITNPGSPQLQKEKTIYCLEYMPEDLVVKNDYVYIVDSCKGLHVVDIADPEDPFRVTEVRDKNTTGGNGIMILDNQLFLADSSGFCPALKVFPLGLDRLPDFENNICRILDDPLAEAEAISAFEGLTVVAGGAAGIEIFDDIQDPNTTKITFPGSYIEDVFVWGIYAYLADWFGSLRTVNLVNQTISGPVLASGDPSSLCMAENYLYIGEGDAGVQVFDISDQEKPQLVSSLSTLTWAEEVAASGEYVYVAVTEGMMVLNALKSCLEVTYKDEETIELKTPSGLASGTYDITVSDPNGYTSVFHNSFTVIENHEPEFIEDINHIQFVYEGENLEIEILADDEDNDQLFYSVSLSRLPAGASLNGNIFTWVPEVGDAGFYTDIRFAVSDGEFIVEQIVDILVEENINNTPPELQAIGNKTVSEGTILSFAVSATDNENDALTFSAFPLPDGATFNVNPNVDNTYWFEWTPAYEQSGIYTICFTAEETDNNLMDNEDIQITVTNTNRSPVITVPEFPQDNKEGIVMALLIEASDPDPEDLPTLEISMQNAPSGADLQILGIQANKMVACFFWTPTYQHVGDYTINPITFIAKDQHSSEGQEIVSFHIQEVNDTTISVEFFAGINFWLCPAGRSNYSSFDFLKEHSEEAIYSLHAYDWDLSLLYSSYWFFGKPSGDNFSMDKSFLYVVYTKSNVFSFSWPLN